jgi:SAM-dependent MidA family methyltransferase
MELSEIISHKISRDGPVSFHDFMEMALYEPHLGYYTSIREQIGPQGDYYTSATITPCFGSLIARQLAEMWCQTGKGAFTIVEYGAGTGALCLAILNHLKINYRDFYDQLQYVIIEKSPAMRMKEKACLKDKVSWHEHIADVGAFSGCVLSNELLDNFPVHQVVMKEELMEIYVDYQHGFVEVLRPAKDALKDYFRQLGVSLPKNFRTEINLRMIGWMKDITLQLQKGFLITIDYGYPSAELYRDHRRNGTLLCYYRHQVHDDPYRCIGEQDITAHVNFSALAHWGLNNGLECCGFCSQGQFLRSLGLLEFLRDAERSDVIDQDVAGQLHNLLADLGSKLKVLIQYKGLPAAKLTGMALAGT